MTSHEMPPGNPLVRLLILLTFTRPRVELTADTLRVSMRWAFGVVIPRSDIAEVGPEPRRRFSIGAHGWRGRWLVNTTTADLVRVTVDPPARGRTLGLPVTVRELVLSVADPDGFTAELRNG